MRDVAGGHDARQRRLPGEALVGEVVPAHHVAGLAGGDARERAVEAQRVHAASGAQLVHQAQRGGVDERGVARRRRDVGARAGGRRGARARARRRRGGGDGEREQDDEQRCHGRGADSLPCCAGSPAQVQECLQKLQIASLLTRFDELLFTRFARLVRCVAGERAASRAGRIDRQLPLGGSSNGRTSGFGPENRGSNPCPPAEAPGADCRPRASVSMPAMAPTVLILAAGQGTRMRSRTPKVLHELCGLPMVLWPVRAALAAGAGRVVVVDSPARALEAVLPEGVELAVQPDADGTGGAVAAAMAHLDAGSARTRRATGAGAERRRAAARAPRRSRRSRGARAQRRGGDDGDEHPRRPERLRARGARRGGRGAARGGDEGRRRRDAAGAARSARSTPASTRSTRRRCARRCRA